MRAIGELQGLRRPRYADTDIAVPVNRNAVHGSCSNGQRTRPVVHHVTCLTGRLRDHEPGNIAVLIVDLDVAVHFETLPRRGCADANMIAVVVDLGANADSRFLEPDQETRGAFDAA